MKKILYFTPCQSNIDSFEKFVKDNQYDIKYGFLLECCQTRNGDNIPYQYALNLMYYLEANFNKLEDIYVIIDYLSMKETWEEETNQEKINKVKGIIRRIILKYPEVYFLFDETLQKGEKVSYLSFFITDFILKSYLSDEKSINLLKEYHSFNRNAPDPFLFLSSRKDNLYDGSNLRYILRRQYFAGLQINTDNFEGRTNSRSQHIGICVEEESSQNRFNSYILYAHGYRVLPVYTSKELKWINESYNTLVDVILRDFDLQFPDEGEGMDEEKKKDEINKIRGWVYNNDKWTCKIDENNIYWGNFKQKKVIMVSQGYKEIKLSKNCIFDCKYLTKEHDNVTFPGIYKPITGIYSALTKIAYGEPFGECIPKQECAFQTPKLACKGGLKYHSFEQNLSNCRRKDRTPLDTSRENHNHSTPLDIYYDLKDMISRSEKYYSSGDYIRAAIVSNEAIELSNGFHRSMVIRAYHIHSLAENAISANSYGCDENELKMDSLKRISLIQEDIYRLANKGDDNEFNDIKTINILNQIFSDCRNYCKGKEHFEAEDIFLSAMAELNEGTSLYGQIRKTKEKIKAIKKKGVLNFLKENWNDFKENIKNLIEKVNSYGTE